MAIKRRYILHQLPVLASLGRTALAALGPRRALGSDAPATPGPEFREVISPRSVELVRDYVRECGGDPRAYRNELPPHLFPQWGFPLAAQTLRAVSDTYPLARVLNGGCRLEINGPLPSDQPLVVSACLESIDDNGRRAVLCQRVATGVDGDPNRVVARLYAIVPLAKRDKGERRERPRVPLDCEEISFFRLRADAGLSFALLTGDFNPVHWSRGYARRFGFRGTILHGFATLARSFEGLVRNRFGGNPRALASLDVKFTQPLVLPADAGLYIGRGERSQTISVGAAPGGPAFMTGSFSRADGPLGSNGESDE